MPNKLRPASERSREITDPIVIISDTGDEYSIELFMEEDDTSQKFIGLIAGLVDSIGECFELDHDEIVDGIRDVLASGVARGVVTH